MEEVRKIMTLCIVRQPRRILLGMKKRGFGAWRWNGFGGKVESGESIEEGAKRELLEEAGIQATSLEKVAVLEFRFFDKPGVVLEGNVFTISEFSGEPTESEEMKPQWFDERDLPTAHMWPGDIYWYPLLLTGKKFKGMILFGENDAVLEQHIEEVHEI